MKFMSYAKDRARGLAVETDEGFRGLPVSDPRFPGNLKVLIAEDRLTEGAEILADGAPIDPDAVTVLPPIPDPEKILCIGLNYRDHAEEAGMALPEYPAMFTRFNSTLIGHGQGLLRPRESEQFDYEAELAIIIGKGGRHIDEDRALNHVAGYSIFNDASLRDYQMRSGQWTPGKNFDATGPFGPCFVAASALPPGCAGLRLQARLNGETVQDGNVDDMVFPPARIVSIASQIMTLKPGDVIITGTPAGVGMGRNPKLWMKAGDTVEIEIDGLGILRNPVADAPV
ncbi:fumarylacetoacetate hydrolase family protein (plasmid) [Paracoccus sp. TK19116]|uniref:Fumarylacetoacetate hydrolase family protein n=1 Tax=Paracoccus albicereus TaxID=2922394 RepID=A0ABT1MLB1_9RHOB|nr:fumarylacetoacetate hydrolase family protein [Paracoccus albicereus]MCQ0969088.1 fumarylacetoacetate hydrolase family protein [Paracoccus albicereus]